MDMRLKEKLMAAFVMIAVVNLISAGVSWVLLDTARERQQDMIDENEISFTHLSQLIHDTPAAVNDSRAIETAVYAEYQVVANCIAEPTLTAIDDCEMALQERKDEVNTSIENLITFTTPEGHEHDSDGAMDDDHDDDHADNDSGMGHDDDTLDHGVMMDTEDHTAVHFEHIRETIDAIGSEHLVFLDHLTDDPTIDELQQEEGILDLMRANLEDQAILADINSDIAMYATQSKDIRKEFRNVYVYNASYITVFDQNSSVLVNYSGDSQELSGETLYWIVTYLEKEFLWQYLDEPHHAKWILGLEDLMGFINGTDDAEFTPMGKSGAIGLLDRYYHIAENISVALMERDMVESRVAARTDISFTTLDIQVVKVLEGNGSDDETGVDFLLDQIEEHRLANQVDAEEHKDSSVLAAGKATDATDQATGSSLVLALGALLLSIVLGLVIADRISKPLVAFTTTAKKVVNDSDMDATFDIDSDDEIGELADAFSKLVNTTKNAMMVLEEMDEE